MLGKAVGDLHDAHRLARGLGPGVGGDPGAVGVGLEGGGGGAHRFILARGRHATMKLPLAWPPPLSARGLPAVRRELR